MDNSPSRKKDWELTQDAFDRLLEYLSHNREMAAVKYESIRTRLIRFFECRGCSSPEDHADITINRVARKLLDGIEIYTADPASFFFGVARNIVQEYWDTSAKHVSVEAPPINKHISQNPTKSGEQEAERLKYEAELDCLDNCLQKLPENSRELIILYYEGEKGDKIRNRKRLSEQRGIPLNALRIRVLRLREKLQDCVSDCVEAQPPGEMESSPQTL